MSNIIIPTRVEEASISAVVTRADGSVKDLGVISYYHRNPLRRVWFNTIKTIKKLTRK